MPGKRAVLIAALVLPLLAITAAWLMADGRAEDAMTPHPMDVVVGDPTAPVRVVVFVALRCRECGEFHRTTFARLKTEWLDTKRAALVYRVVALNDDDFAVTKFLRCVGGPNRPDRTRTWIDAAFRDPAWLAAADPVQGLQRAGRELELDRAGFDRLCLDNPLVEEAVLTGRAAARAVGVRSLPAIYVDGRRVVPSELERALAAQAR
jgi:protein-disulfide isomerase